MKNQKEPLILPLIGTIAFLLLGLLLIIKPLIVAVFPPLIGLVLIVVGALGMAQCIVMNKRMIDPGLKFIQSLINIVVGLVFIIKQDISLAFLAILFGLYIIISAAITFSESLQERKIKKPWLANFMGSILQCILGAVLLYSPFSEKDFWVRMLGLYFVISAHNILHWLLELKNMRKPDDKTDKNTKD